MKKFVNDILVSLSKKDSKSHNDIKLDNIVRCSKRYKLIDWGLAADNGTILNGNLACTSPIRFYLARYPAVVARNLFTAKESRATRSTPAFQDVYNRVLKEFNEEIGSLNRTQLLYKFKNTFDVFMFGMTCLYAVIKYDVSYEEYAPLIAALTSLKNPLTADEALAYSKKFFKGK
jgi:serine/threonine protein kinase